MTAPVPFSEDALAEELAERLSGTFRYVAAVTTRNKWFLWNGESETWEVDHIFHVRNLIRDLCREAAARCGDTTLARQLCSAHTVNAVESLARADRRLAATKEQVGLPKKRTRKAGVA
jgi:putative DNA primase/helicase